MSATDAVRPGNQLPLWILWVLLTAGCLIGLTLSLLNRLDGPGSWNELSYVFLPITLAIGSLGCLILSKLPSHAVGWLLTVVSFGLLVSITATEYAYHTLVANPGSLPLGLEATPVSWVGGTAFFLLASLLLLIFPEGRPLPGRWRWFVPLAIVCTLLASLGEFLRPGPLDTPLEAFDNPTGIEALDNVTFVLSAIGFMGLAACGIAGAASVVSRFRSANGIEKHQLRWIAFAGVIFITSWIVSASLAAAGAASADFRQVVVGAGVSTIPIAAGIAILRYRLYDIDWIIARALVYIPLTAVLAGLYVAITGILRTVLATGSSTDMSVAITTVIVVAGLAPIKDYLQAQVNAHFKEGRGAVTAIARLAEETQSVANVLDTSAYLRRFLKQLVDILDARGALIRIDSSPFPEVLLEGDWDGEPEIEMSLYHDEHVQGSLQVGDRIDGHPYGHAEVEALRRSAAALGHLLHIHREADPLEPAPPLALAEAEATGN